MCKKKIFYPFRSLVLPDQESANVDLKHAAVIIISHLDRLAIPHLPTGSFTSKVSVVLLHIHLIRNKKYKYIFILGNASNAIPANIYTWLSYNFIRELWFYSRTSHRNSNAWHWFTIFCIHPRYWQ